MTVPTSAAPQQRFIDSKVREIEEWAEVNSVGPGGTNDATPLLISIPLHHARSPEHMRVIKEMILERLEHTSQCSEVAVRVFQRLWDDGSKELIIQVTP